MAALRNRVGLRDRLARLRGETVDRDLSPFDAELRDIAQAEDALAGLDEAGLRGRAAELKAQAGAGGALHHLAVPAFALVREAARRCLGLRAFEEQVLAGLGLLRGRVVEMQTGEGKTLAAVFPAALLALAGRGVHVLTFNDYLARRDAEWMGPAYAALGLRTGWVQGTSTPAERREAYAADVTYVTAQEAGFDFLRDGLATSPEDRVQRPFHAALVDEADSLLIDEARVPLVIAGPAADRRSSAAHLAAIVARLLPGTHFGTDEHARNVELTDAGLLLVEEELGCGPLHEPANLALLTELSCALHAEVLLRRDADYIVRGAAIEIVDETTGRVVKGRHWPDGLQAALEAKEGLARRPDGRILGSITLQHFLGLYPRLAGMTGTAQDAAGELAEMYGLRVLVVPTHRPVLRADQPDAVFTHRAAKEEAVVDEVVRLHAQGRPVLVGTATVAESEALAARLGAAGVRCALLNARNDADEARVVAEAGARGAVTISTNMAGRGTDIRLGGADGSERAAVAALGGLYVLGTSRQASRRIDQQLRGRAGRQGDPGASRFFVSLDDALLERFGLRALLPAAAVPAVQEGPVESAIVRREVERAQRIVEGQDREIRRTLWHYASAVEHQRRAVFARREALLGGPAGAGERRAALQRLDTAWSDHLAALADLREGIHLVRLGGGDPLSRFKLMASQLFEGLEDALAQEDPLPTELEVQEPSATWTYLVNDDPFREQIGMQLIGPGRATLAMGAAAMVPPLLLLLGLADRWQRRRRSRGP